MKDIPSNLSMMKTFEPGTVVVFDPNNLNPEFWDNLLANF